MYHESECIVVYMNVKRDRVYVRIYKSQASNQNTFLTCVHWTNIQSFLLFALNNHSPTLVICFKE